MKLFFRQKMLMGGHGNIHKTDNKIFSKISFLGEKISREKRILT